MEAPVRHFLRPHLPYLAEAKISEESRKGKGLPVWCVTTGYYLTWNLVGGNRPWRILLLTPSLLARLYGGWRAAFILVASSKWK